jgi:hypothetical protein
VAGSSEHSNEPSGGVSGLTEGADSLLLQQWASFWTH